MNLLFVFLLIACPGVYSGNPSIRQPEKTETGTSPYFESKNFSTINSIVKNLYQSLTYEHGKEPNLKEFKQLFIKGARLVHVKNHKYVTMTPDSFAVQFKNQIDNGVLKSYVEHEVSRKTDTLGNVVHVFSTYKTNFMTDNGIGHSHGINSIQLLKSNGRWWIVSILWDEANSNNPIPPKYLDISR